MTSTQTMKLFLVSSLTLLLSIAVPAASRQETSADLRQEEAEDYYEKWLNEDVTYIISDEERTVFEQLSTPEEKEQFIEQFWFRRDPDRSTAQNEFKEEHYRRLAYANERFSSGLPGWMTDRGRIYIIHGPPAEIEAHPAGGTYERPIHEGGGSTVTYPFEIWRYRHIEGIGSDIELEFVDPSLTGEYRLALLPEEKDALLYVPGGGQTLAEELGMASKADRPYFSPGNRDRYPMMYGRAKDSPFQRYETYAMIQRPTEIKYQDLKEMVRVDVGYQSIPIEVHNDYFRLNDSQVLVPISVQIRNQDLSFSPEEGRHVARLAVYGLVSNMGNRVVAEFEDDLLTSFREEEVAEGLRKRSIYQKMVTLESGARYKLDLVVKDLKTGQVGATRQAITAPKLPEDHLAASSLVLSDSIQVLDGLPSADEMFAIGDVKVRPNLGLRFDSATELGVYFHIYNAGLDQASLEPALTVDYELHHQGRKVREVKDEAGDSIQYFSGTRVVLVKKLDLRALPPGEDYQLKVRVEDRQTGDSLELSQRFEVVASGEIRAAAGSE